MTTRTKLYASTALLALTLGLQTATAQNGIPEGLNAEVRSLQTKGWNVTEVEKTFWGRWVIEAEKDGVETEMVLSGDGERVIRTNTENDRDRDSARRTGISSRDNDESNDGVNDRDSDESNDSGNDRDSDESNDGGNDRDNDESNDSGNDRDNDESNDGGSDESNDSGNDRDNDESND